MAAKAKTTTQESSGIELEPLKLGYQIFLLIGTTPLLVHKFSEKARRQMLAKQMGKNVEKEFKDPFMDFCASMYWVDPAMPKAPVEADVRRASFGFPVIAFKNAAVTACTSNKNITKVAARQAFQVIGDCNDPETGKQLLRIYTNDPPKMNEETVRVGMTTDIRYRGQFDTWRVYLPVIYNRNVISPEQVANLLRTGGFGVGIGEWRPEKDGQLGMYSVATPKEWELWSAKDRVDHKWFYDMAEE